MKYRGVIFDLDGTLADTLDDIAGSMNRVLAAHQYQVHPVNTYKLLVGRGLDNLVAQALPEEARSPGNVEICLAGMIADYAENCLVKTHLYPGILELINVLIRLQVKLCVFSNKAGPLTNKIVKHLLGDIPFVQVLGALQGYPKKPDPAGAVYLSSKMAVDPSEIVYLGDSDVDMITANQAGMFAAGVSWGFRSRRELLKNGARIILDRPHELIEKLEF